jgi:hypothetical protein
LLLASLYLLMPNTAELHANVTNSQWYLALAAFLIVISDAAPNRIWKAFDNVLLLLSGLSGPFSIFLTPIRSGSRGAT